MTEKKFKPSKEERFEALPISGSVDDMVQAIKTDLTLLPTENEIYIINGGDVEVGWKGEMGKIDVGLLVSINPETKFVIVDCGNGSGLIGCLPKDRNIKWSIEKWPEET